MGIEGSLLNYIRVHNLPAFRPSGARYISAIYSADLVTKLQPDLVTSAGYLLSSRSHINGLGCIAVSDIGNPVCQVTTGNPYDAECGL